MILGYSATEVNSFLCNNQKVNSANRSTRWSNECSWGSGSIFVRLCLRFPHSGLKKHVSNWHLFCEFSTMNGRFRIRATDGPFSRLRKHIMKDGTQKALPFREVEIGRAHV